MNVGIRFLGTILISIVVQGATPALATEACGNGKTVELDRAGFSLEKLPVMAQENPSCWAFSAVELVEAWRLSHNPQPPVGGPNFLASPTDVYRQVCKTRDCKKGGRVEWAIDYLRTHPACNQFAIAGRRAKSLDNMSQYNAFSYTRDGGLRNGMTLQYKKLWAASRTARGSKEMLKIYQSIVEANPSWGPDRIGLQGMYIFAKRHGYAEDVCASMLNAGMALPSTSFPPLDVLAAYLAQNDVNKYLDLVHDRVCGQNGANYGPVIPALHSESTTNTRHIIEVLNHALDAPNPQPVEISICSAVLDHQRPYRGRNPYKDCDDAKILNFHDGPDQHGVVVVGRRVNETSGHCEFLVRNTWGLDCAVYKNAPAHWDCRNGQIWVDATDLASNAFGLSWLGP